MTTAKTAIEMARLCMEQRGHLVIALPFPLPHLPFVNKNGTEGPYGNLGCPVVAVAETTVQDLNEQAELIGTGKFPDDYQGYIYKVVAE